mmetsp:Transcript_39730/g.94159  ORF Transcript_39730/g.94159 Transcript_39730/m.94159 type:complete len:303 (-) Transcript_39730:146-1054(-)
MASSAENCPRSPNATIDTCPAGFPGGGGVRKVLHADQPPASDPTRYFTVSLGESPVSFALCNSPGGRKPAPVAGGPHMSGVPYDEGGSAGMVAGGLTPRRNCTSWLGAPSPVVHDTRISPEVPVSARCTPVGWWRPATLTIADVASTRAGPAPPRDSRVMPPSNSTKTKSSRMFGRTKRRVAECLKWEMSWNLRGAVSVTLSFARKAPIHSASCNAGALHATITSPPIAPSSAGDALTENSFWRRACPCWTLLGGTVARMCSSSPSSPTRGKLKHGTKIGLPSAATRFVARAPIIPSSLPAP